MRLKTVKNKDCNDFYFEWEMQSYFSDDITFAKIKGFVWHGDESD